MPSKRKEKIKMYKEIIICILVVIFIFSMDLISNNYTKNVFFNINDELSNLRNEITSEDKKEEIEIVSIVYFSEVANGSHIIISTFNPA